MKYSRLVVLSILIIATTNIVVAASDVEVGMTLKYGTYGIGTQFQTVKVATDTYDIDGSTTRVNVNLANSSEYAMGAEFEVYFDSGLGSVGFEAIFIRNNYTLLGFSAALEKVETAILSANLKVNFNHDGLINPYIGSGLGTSFNYFSGPNLNGETIGMVVTPRVGASLNYGDFGIIVEALYIRSVIDDTPPNTSNLEAGMIEQDYDPTGLVYFIGVSGRWDI